VPSAFSDFAGGRGGIVQAAHEQGHVHASCNKVDIAVLENDVDVERRVFPEKDREARHHDEAREGERTADAQAAGQCRARTSCREFRFIGFFDGPSGAVIKAVTGLGRRQAVRGTQQQSHAKPILELRDRFGDGGLADAELLCCARKRAGVDNPHKRFHRGESIHAYSLKE
jgi:hypothetical protein